jgi:anaphase-promoting complex subunit 4
VQNTFAAALPFEATKPCHSLLGVCALLSSFQTNDLLFIITMTGSQHSPAADMARPMLNVVGEKFLPSRCRPGTLSYCPTMDLVAVVAVLDLPGNEGRTEEKLSVWRLNGQQVFAWDAPSGIQIPFVRWKMDGRLLALGTSDGLLRLLNVMNAGKRVHCLAVSPALATGCSDLSSLSWVVNFGDAKGTRPLLGEEVKVSALDDLFSLSIGKDAMAKMKADLPRELACGIDVETSIPNLSALPPGTGAGGEWCFGGAEGE